MSTDTLTEAVANMESAWRRLREVLDGPDVAVALVSARDEPMPMTTAPRDGTFVMLHFDTDYKVRAYCRSAGGSGPASSTTWNIDASRSAGHP